jgi:DNA mismatch repair ATPase MutS
MDWVKNIVNKKEEEPSLEEQVQLWQTNLNDTSKIKKILFPNSNKKLPLVKIDDHVYNDLEFFDTHDGNNEHSVSYALGKHAVTPYGKHVIDHLLRNPLINYSDIKERQWVTNHFVTKNTFFQKIKTFLTSIKNPEEIFWLWKETDEQTQTLYDLVYFKMPIIGNFVNSSETVLTATSTYKLFMSPFFSIMTPILCFIIPFIFLRYMGIKVSFMQIFRLLRSRVFSVGFISRKTTSLAILSTVVWFAMYFYNTYTIVSMSMLTNKITNILHDKLRLAAQIVKITSEMKIMMASFPGKIKKFLNVPDCNPHTEILLLRDTILLPSSIFRNKGCILSSYWKIKGLLHDLAERIRFIGYVDSFYAITTYLNELKNHKLPWTFVKFGAKKRSQVKFWHPSVLSNGKKPVPNSLKVKKKTNTLIITGPNAAGKSTYVKTIFINSLLAQTLGIAFAKKWEVPKPYFYIDTYFNVPDVEGKTSTFQAEMKRCFKFVSTLEHLKKHVSCQALVALDEIFTSTNYKEGIAGAYSIIKYISDNFPDVLCLVTTHYHSLAELQDNSNKKIMNYCLHVKRNVEGKLVGNSFKVKKGVSKEHVALDLLELEGFSNEIIDMARNTYNNISAPSVRFFSNG